MSSHDGQPHPRAEAMYTGPDSQEGNCRGEHDVGRQLGDLRGCAKGTVRGDGYPLGHEHPVWLAYQLPSWARSTKTGRGQIRTLFLFRSTGNEDSISVEVESLEQEFSRWRWMTLSNLISVTWEVRRLVY